MTSYISYSNIPPLDQGFQGKYKVVQRNNFQICICEVFWAINNINQVKISQRDAPNTTNQEKSYGYNKTCIKDDYFNNISSYNHINKTTF